MKEKSNRNRNPKTAKFNSDIYQPMPTPKSNSLLHYTLKTNENRFGTIVSSNNHLRMTRQHRELLLTTVSTALQLRRESAIHRTLHCIKHASLCFQHTEVVNELVRVWKNLGTEIVVKLKIIDRRIRMWSYFDQRTDIFGEKQEFSGERKHRGRERKNTTAKRVCVMYVCVFCVCERKKEKEIEIEIEREKWEWLVFFIGCFAMNPDDSISTNYKQTRTPSWSRLSCYLQYSST